MDFDLKNDFRRAVLYDRMDPAVTQAQAQDAAREVERLMAKVESTRSISVVAHMGNRYHVAVLLENPLSEKDAPPEFVDGVYVSVDRVGSLDYFFGAKNGPGAPRP